MPSEKAAKIIESIQRLHLKLETDFNEKLPAIFEQLADETVRIIDNSEINFSARDPKVRAQSIKEAQRLQLKLSDALISIPEYQNAVNGLTTGMKALTVLSNSYFSDLIDNFDDKPALYKEILTANIDSVKSKLLGAGVRDNFANSIEDVLRASIAGRSKRADFNKAVRNAIVPDPTKPEGYLKRYVKVTANDAIQTFNAEYFETISTDLGFEHYFYQGTIIEDSRPFCKARAGRYFTKQEIENWAGLKGWSGRMPGTDKNTIFIFRGGYGCRHLILPVTQAEFEKQSEKGKTGMK